MATTREKNEFEVGAGRVSESLLGELWLFLRDNKKWWLLPIILVLLFLGVLIMLSGSAAAPFVYTLF